jgi:phosphatidyl-myo-inositol dimannoside synthase
MKAMCTGLKSLRSIKFKQVSKNIALYSLQTFGSTGGIQKMTRTLAHSLNAIATKNKWSFQFWSAYDSEKELMPKYVGPENFYGFGRRRLKFTFDAILNAKNQDIIVLTHVNLAIIGLLAKIVNPKCEIWLVAHGIEIWRPLPWLKKLFLKRCDKVICVSNFTMHVMVTRHKLLPESCVVINNAVDPFMKLPETFVKPAYLVEKYGLSANSPIIFTLTRLSSWELYKGHDRVISIISKLKERYPAIKYVLAGKPDLSEQTRIEQLIIDYGVSDQVVLTGFIDEEELVDHFLLADLFILPSKKEGFGIVFIEALACGVPVICGNADGSVDAICNGELGTSINPDDLDELERAATSMLNKPPTAGQRKHLQQKCLEYFGEDTYIKKFEALINEV